MDDKIKMMLPENPGRESQSACIGLLSALPTTKQINDACLFYRHDYGLMGPEEGANLQWESLEWLKSWSKALDI